MATIYDFKTGLILAQLTTALTPKVCAAYRSSTTPKYGAIAPNQNTAIDLIVKIKDKVKKSA